MRLCLVLVPYLFAATLLSQEIPQSTPASSDIPYVEREEKQFNFFPGGKIEILTGVPGSVKVVGWKKGSVLVEAEKIVYYESEADAKAFLKQSPLRVRYNQTSATIRAMVAPAPPAIMEVNYTVYVPGERTDISAKVEKGDFSIDGVNGWVEASVKEGSIEAKSLAGYFSGLAMKGDIFVEMSGVRWRGFELAALTQQGSVNLALPAEYSAALQLETRKGKISVDYPPRVFEGEEIPFNVITKKTAQMLKAAVGQDGAPIKLATYSGDITLSLLAK